MAGRVPYIIRNRVQLGALSQWSINGDCDSDDALGSSAEPELSGQGPH